MNKLVEFLQEYPTELERIYRKGLITNEEHNLAAEFYQNTKIAYTNYVIKLEELAANLEKIYPNN